MYLSFNSFFILSNILILFLWQPSHSFTISPFTVLFFLRLSKINPSKKLLRKKNKETSHAICHFPNIPYIVSHPPIQTLHTHAFYHFYIVLYIFSCPAIQIRPHYYKNKWTIYLPIHFIIISFTIISPFIIPYIFSFSMDIIVIKLTNVFTPIRPFKHSFTTLLPINIITLVTSAIRPCFLSFSLLLIILSTSHINSSISMRINAITTSFTQLPFAFINIAIRMYQSASSLDFIVEKLPFIDWSIFPDFCPFPVLLPFRISLTIVSGIRRF